MKREPIESNIGTYMVGTTSYEICYNCRLIKDEMNNNIDILNLTLSGVNVPNIIERNGIYISKIINGQQIINVHPKVDFLQKLTIDDAQKSRWCKECGVLVDHRVYLKKLSVNAKNVIDISITFFAGEELPKKLSIKLPANVSLTSTTETHEWLKYELYELVDTKVVSADLSSINTVGTMSLNGNEFSIVFDNTPTFTIQTTFVLRMKQDNFQNIGNIDAYDVIQVASYETIDKSSYLNGYVGFVELNTYKTPHVDTDDIDNDFGIPEEDLIVLTKNVLYVFGANGWGQLGTGRNVDVITPIGSLFEHPINISIRKDFTLGLNKDGKLFGWGHNQYGQLTSAVAKDRNPHPIPTEIVLSGLGTGVKVTDMKTGWFHSLILDSNQKVWAVGRNQKGQLGDGTTTNSSDFVEVKQLGFSLPPITKISTTSDFSLALDENNKVWKWGNGDIRAQETYTYESLSIAPFTDVKEIATGSYHSLSLKEDGTVWGLGFNFSGQLGIGSTQDRAYYQDANQEEYIKWIQAEVTNIKQIDAGEEHSVAVNNNKKVLVWGDNRFGQIGDGKYTVENIENNNKYKPYELNKSITNIFKTTIQRNGNWEFTITNDLDINEHQVDIYIEGANGNSKSLTFNLEIKDSGTNTFTTTDLLTVVDGVNPLGLTLSKGNFYETIDKTPKLFGTTTNAIEGDILHIVFYVNSFDNVSKVICGTRNTIAIKEDGTVWAWGHNPSNLFIESDDKLLYPTRIKKLEGKEQIVLGEGSVLYIQKDKLT